MRTSRTRTSAYSLSAASALLSTSRPHNAAAAGLTTAVGAVVAGGIDALGTGAVIIGIGGSILAVMAANLRNDAVDAAADEINAPHRPVPQGYVSVRAAHTAAMVAMAGAMSCAAHIGGRVGAAGAAAVALAMLYSPWLKSTVLAGNMVVASVSALTLPFGAAISGQVAPSLWPRLWHFSAVLMLYIGAREILKCIADEAGDRLTGTASIVTRWGRNAARAAVAVLGSTMAVLLLVYVPSLGTGGVLRMLVTVPGMLAPLIALWAAHRITGTGAVESAPTKTAALVGVLSLTKLGGFALLIAGWCLMTGGRGA